VYPPLELLGKGTGRGTPMGSWKPASNFQFLF
jgi:hypothetical protein